ncbi:MAG: MarR family transcriptional regulator [Fulvivirga sp.]|uniref:MarR family winged helix-turn-helix transcriptional regulator n=1 Tax=Fulvivirga sp. TaxID=1931237 RepID=UPI0032ECA08B
MKFEEEIKQRKFRSAQQKATLNLLFTSNWLSNKHKDFFKEYGLTPQQYNVLRILRGQFPNSISTSDIKNRMLDKHSDTSRIVDRLTLKGWVTKKECPSDRRLVDVVISKDGLDLLSRMDTATNQLDETLGLTEDEASQLSKLLDKIRG